MPAFASRPTTRTSRRTPWIRLLIDRYHQKAEAEGTRIIPCCGFDSIPSDLGAAMIADALGPETCEVKAFFQMRGGLNGGTLASALNMYESGSYKTTADLFLLSPGVTRPPHDLETDPVGAIFDPDLKSWVAPFVMGAIIPAWCAAVARFAARFRVSGITEAGGHFAATMLAKAEAFFQSMMGSRPCAAC